VPEYVRSPSRSDGIKLIWLSTGTALHSFCNFTTNNNKIMVGVKAWEQVAPLGPLGPLGIVYTCELLCGNRFEIYATVSL
jgi:hypothetical protein